LAAAVAMLVAGCATQPASDHRAARLTDNLQIYDMYDNSRDWGPAFLVGPPAHHLGDQSRIDDTRLVPRLDARDGAAADPSKPPMPEAARDSLTTKPLPPLP
jgi:hypothetical protein